MLPRGTNFLCTVNIIHILLLLCACDHDSKFVVSAVVVDEPQTCAINPKQSDQKNVDNQQENLQDETSSAEDSPAFFEDDHSFEDDGYEEYLKFNVFGRPQLSVTGVSQYEVQQNQTYNKTFEYMKQVFENPKYEFIRYRCRNLDHMCNILATNGACIEEEDDEYWMIENCSPACGTCDVLEEEFYDDEETRTEEFKLVNDSSEPPSIDLGLLQSTVWGIPQNLGTMDEQKQKVLSLLQSTREYFFDELVEEGSSLAIYCENKHKDCSIWATMGICETNPGYMQIHCAPACHSCNMLYVDERCPIDPEAPSVFSKPGDMNRMFERITKDPYWELNHGPVSIISSPAMGPAPWVVTLDNFLTDEECDKFIEFGHLYGFKRSLEQGEVHFDGTSDAVPSESRTSAESECRIECAEDAILKHAFERVEKLTDFPQENWEWAKLLQYEVGQHYQLHTDFIEVEVQFPAGPIVLTVYFFLSDVEAGGGMYFDTVGPDGTERIIPPKKGRAVIWPSVLDEDPLTVDDRTYHAGLPVEAGVKYGVTVWIHNRDYKEALKRNCISY